MSKATAAKSTKATGKKNTASTPKKAAATKPVKKVQLEDLLSHLCCSTGLYSKETFMSLFSCITRMLRERPMEGVALLRTLNDEAFETMACAIENSPSISLNRFDDKESLPDSAGISEHTGFLIVLTNRMCALLYWSKETDDTYRMYQGGWTFHPGDTKTMAMQLAQHLDNPELESQIDNTPIDRRYDDKLNDLITTLVHGLENQNRQLTVALNKVSHLNHQVVESERLAAIGQLSSVIAHEIRNPLGLISLYAKIVEDQLGQVEVVDTDTEKVSLLQKNLGMIREATDGLEVILSELTQYSRPLELNRQETNVVGLVRDVASFYQPKYDEKGVTLVLPDEAQEAITLEIDKDRIRQSLINLLKNALEASNEGTTVNISAAQRRQDPNLYIKVSDEGCGIDDRAQQKLFTPYFSTKGTGTGLGLAHSRKILQAHGGNVELLTSTKGEGSVFAIILPGDTE